MNNYFKKIIQLLILLTISPFAHADIVAGPELVVIPMIFLIIVGALVVGTVNVAYRILKWIKSKYSKK